MPDIFLTSAGALPDGEHRWPNILVIGKHKLNPNEDRSVKTLRTRGVWKPTGPTIRTWFYDLGKRHAVLVLIILMHIVGVLG
jgi:hypothetical protein